ncbi:hypothetical protein FWH58_03295 [Candidatus Saccharibacteria bacterium]|nr:hypothetical protein [Candidatus Saccharibacteria bacterium]
MKGRGFTIIEVSLFLAISGALVLLTLGLWTMVARQRFQDTMTTLRSTIQSEYEEVRTSMNERLGGTYNVEGCVDDGVITSGDRTGNSKCLVIGKLLEFTPGNRDIKISYVVSIGGANADYSSLSDEEALRKMGTDGTLAVIGNSNDSSSSGYSVKTTDPAIIPRTVRIEWGGEFATSWTIPETDNPQTSSSLAILHSPISSAIIVFSFAPTNPVTTAGKLQLSVASARQPIAIMIRNTQRGFGGAAICIDDGPSSIAARTAIPADPYYDFGAVSPPYSPSLSNLRELCSI